MEGRHPGLVILSRPAEHESGGLCLEEMGVVQNAIESRQREFYTGRQLAREGFLLLGMSPVSVPQGPNREPIWPATIVGSISHAAAQVVLVMAKRTQYSGVGVDLEQKSRVEENLLGKLVTANEQRQHGNIDYTLIFSAKESIYKLLFPIVGEYIDFLDVEVKLCLKTNAFTAEYVGSGGYEPLVLQIRGSFLNVNSLWMTCATTCLTREDLHGGN